MNIRPLLLGSLLLTLPFAASAEWYGGPALLIGATQQDNTVDNIGTATLIDDSTDGIGIAAGASGLLGYDFTEDGMPFALEFSGNWRARHDMNIGYQVGINSFGVKSNVQTFDFMTSLLYDIPLGTTLQPFIGGGVGVAHIMADNEYLAGAPVDIGETDSTNFAWALQGGLKYPLDEDMKLRVDYRYIDLGEIDTPTTPGGEQFTSELDSHDIRIGVTWDF